MERAGILVLGASMRDAQLVLPEALAQVTDAEGSNLGLAGHRVGLVEGSFFHLIAAESI